MPTRLARPRKKRQPDLVKVTQYIPRAEAEKMARARECRQTAACTLTGSALVALRQRFHVQQEDLAALAGVSIRTVVRFEQLGDAELPVLAAHAIHAIFAHRGAAHS